MDSTVLYHHRTQGRGVEAVHITGVCSGFRELGYSVTVVGPPGTSPDPDIVVSAETGQTGTVWGRIARSAPELVFECLELGYNLAALPVLLAQIRRHRPAFIYERYAIFNAAGVVAASLTRTPIVIEVNDLAGEDRTRQGKRTAMEQLAQRCERFLFRRAAGVVVVSGYLRDRVAALGGDARRIRVVPNAVDPRRFDPETAHGARIRETLGLENTTVVGFVGSFTKWHGVDLLIRATAGLAGACPDLRLLLVGDGARRAEAEALARQLGISDRVLFPGKVPHAEVPHYIAAMDVGVVPGGNEFVSPVKVFEYMAMRKPAVVPRYRAAVEAIGGGDYGRSFAPGDEDDLSAALLPLVQHRELRESLGDAARRNVLAAHLWVHNAEEAAELASMVPGTAARGGGAPTAANLENA